MSDKSRGYIGFDVLKETIWTLLLTLAFFVYWVVLLLILSFLFNSIIKLSLDEILVISVFLSVCFFIYRSIKAMIRFWGK